MIDRLDTTQYESSHNQKPSGRGLWTYQIEGEPIRSYKGTVSQLKRRIQHEASDRSSLVIILP